MSCKSRLSTSIISTSLSGWLVFLASLLGLPIAVCGFWRIFFDVLFECLVLDLLLDCTVSVGGGGGCATEYEIGCTCSWGCGNNKGGEGEFWAIVHSVESAISNY